MSPSVAIVGHGKNLFEACLGEEIDSFDIVVRMNNCGWQFAEDYGSKYDYGIGTNLSVKLRENKNPKNEMWVYNKHGDLTKPCVHKNITGKLSKFIKSEKSVSDYGMSRGCAGLIASIVILGLETIKVFGMSQLLTGEFQTDPYSADYLEYHKNIKPDGVPSRRVYPLISQTHDWAAENRIAFAAAKSMKCRLEW